MSQATTNPGGPRNRAKCGQQARQRTGATPRLVEHPLDAFTLSGRRPEPTTTVAIDQRVNDPQEPFEHGLATNDGEMLRESHAAARPPDEHSPEHGSQA